MAPDFLQYLREDADLASVHGDAVVAETRVNPDGTLDISRWARPQHDGPPLRALALLRWAAGGHLDAPLLAELTALIRFDLDFTLRHWREPSYDIWEEESGHHYYTLRVSAAALAEGAAWLQGLGDTAQAQRCRRGVAGRARACSTATGSTNARTIAMRARLLPFTRAGGRPAQSEGAGHRGDPVGDP